MLIPLSITTTPGRSLTVRVWLDDEVLDWHDGTFKTPGGATTPYQSLTEHEDVAGESRSSYTTLLELNHINATDSQVIAFWGIYEAGQLVSDVWSLAVVAGRLAHITTDFLSAAAIEQLRQAAQSTPWDANLKRRTTITRTS